MPDYDFELDPADVVYDYAQKAAVAAVLLPLVPPARGGDGRRGLVDSLNKLRDHWRMRLRYLSRGGWEALSTLAEKPVDGEPTPEWAAIHRSQMLRFQIARNCPPFGVIVKRQAYTCKLGRVCPFCYGRGVIEAYRALEWGLLSTLGKDPWPKVKLLGVRMALPSLRTEQTTDVRLVGFTRSGLFTDVKRLKDAGVEVLGARINILCEPIANGSFVLKRLGLFVVPANANTVRVPWKLSTTCKELPANRANLSRLVGWTFSYPLGMLRGDPATAAWILNAMSSGRLATNLAVGIADNIRFRQVTQKYAGKENDG